MKILFASTNLPDPPHSGGAQRTELLHRSLCKLGSVECVFLLPKLPSLTQQAALQEKYQVKYILTTAEITDRQNFRLLDAVLPKSISADLQSFFKAGRHRWRPYAPFVRLFRDLEQYDLIVTRYLQVAATFDLFRSNRLIVDIDDYEPDRLRLRLDKSSFYKRLTLKRSMYYSAKAHRKLLKKLRQAWISNPHDRQHSGLEQGQLLPNIPYPDFLKTDEKPKHSGAQKPYFLIIGSMNYSANEDAVDYFIQNCWTELIQDFPEAEFVIVGSKMSEKQRIRWRKFPGVEPQGFVENLAEVYANARAVVAPIQFGAGTNIKVLEAAAFGCALILTPVARRGFEAHLVHEECCLLSETIEEMRAHCQTLLADPNRAAKIGQKAQAVIREHYNYGTFEASVHKLCRETAVG